ncbi:MAG: type II secretion system GspH family protein [Gammaproteobacteria bacterium]|nr:type II secretion system GspH family protein [Gammaproteobacteria bacterium]
MPRSPRQAGFTFIELVISIVIIAAAVGGIMVTVANTVARSVDPMIQTQAIILAQGYLDEALLRPYAPGPATCSDPDGARDQFDDVADYGCVNNPNGPRDQYGNPLPGLADYNVSMSVTDTSLGGVATRRVEVRVTHDSQGIDIRLAGHRASY